MDEKLLELSERYEGLAMDVLAELKKQMKRWMIAFFTVLILWAATIFSFVYYLNQYDTISYDLDGDGVNNVNTGTQEDMFNGTEGQNPD